MVVTTDLPCRKARDLPGVFEKQRNVCGFEGKELNRGIRGRAEKDALTQLIFLLEEV